MQQDNPRLFAHNEDLEETVTSSRKELVLAARVPSSSLGRVKDIFDELALNSHGNPMELLLNSHRAD